MAQSKVEELKLDLAELVKLSALAERQKIKDLCFIEIRKLETEIAGINESLNKENTSQEAPKKLVSAQNRCYNVQLTNYAWDQSDNFVKLFVTVPNVHTISEDSVHCDFTARSVKMSIKSLENRNYTFSLQNLLENIDIATSKWKVKKDMVVVFLAKDKKSEKWSHLTTIEKKAKEPKSKLPDMGSSGDPTSNLMDLMKQMYEDGDDEMKKTIAQSWTEGSKSRGGW